MLRDDSVVRLDTLCCSSHTTRAMMKLLAHSLLDALPILSAGAGIVAGRAVIRDLYAGAAALRLYALVVMLFALAPAIGTVLGEIGRAHVCTPVTSKTSMPSPA